MAQFLAEFVYVILAIKMFNKLMIEKLMLELRFGVHLLWIGPQLSASIGLGLKLLKMNWLQVESRDLV